MVKLSNLFLVLNLKLITKVCKLLIYKHFNDKKLAMQSYQLVQKRLESNPERFKHW